MWFRMVGDGKYGNNSFGIVITDPSPKTLTTFAGLIRDAGTSTEVNVIGQD
jgi:hypothetical protein